MTKTARSGRRSRKEWAAEVARWRRSELSASQYAAEHGLKRSTLLWWSSQLGPVLAEHAKAKAGTAPMSFVPVRVREESKPGARVSETGRLEVVLGNGRRVCVFGAVDIEQLALVLDAAEGGASC